MSESALSQQEELARAARQRMERWLLSEQLRQHMQAAHDTGRPGKPIGPYITISREAGAEGQHIARLVGQRLDWDVLDKELLDFMAQRYSLPRDMLEFVDETKANWVHDILGNWFDSSVVTHEKYVVLLERIMRLAALHGHIVVVGRAGQCVLPHEYGLAVRLMAPLLYRMEQMSRRRHVSLEEARRMIVAIDAGRRDFVHRYFHHDVDDPPLYDLVINVGRFGAASAAEQILHAYQSQAERSKQGRGKLIQV